MPTVVGEEATKPERDLAKGEVFEIILARGESTFAQFEKRMGISSSTLHRIKLGEQNVTIDTLEQGMDRLKVSMGDFFDVSKR